MYRKIMVAVDGSETSKRALAEALRVARFAQAEVHLVHVVDMMAPPGMSAAYVPLALLDAHREDGMKLLDDARTEAMAAGVHCETELLELQSVADDVADCLQRCAQRCGADLVALGTHGRRGVRRAVLGSVAERFVRESVCPVLLVRVREPHAAQSASRGNEEWCASVTGSKRRTSNVDISFSGKPPVYETDDGPRVSFVAIVDGADVDCSITAEALEDHFGAASLREPDLLTAFAAHRPAIEAGAARLLEATGGKPVLLHSGFFRIYRSDGANPA